jgi:hypothetical protein
MNLAIISRRDSRQTTARNAVARLAIRLNLSCEDNGSMSLETLRQYIISEGARVRSGEITHSTLESYVSALSATHLDNFIDWTSIRNHPCIRRLLSVQSRDPRNPPRQTVQDYPVNHRQLIHFCSTIDPSRYDHVLACALVTTLFWGIGRVPELLHAPHHARMSSSCIIPYILASGFGRAFKIFLERPKIIRSTSQYISPIQVYDKSNPSYWMTLLAILRPDSFTSPWQMGPNTHATPHWLYSMFSSIIPDTLGLLGPCSFRAGGFSYLLSLGHDFRLLAALGRWSSDAVDRYLRDHNQVIVEALAARNRDSFLSTHGNFVWS